MISVRRPAERPTADFIAAALALVAAGLTVAALFWPYLVHVWRDGGFTDRMEVGLWTTEVDPGGEDWSPDEWDWTPKFGIVFVVVAVALVGAALRAHRTARSGRGGDLARTVLVAAAAASVAATTMLFLQVMVALEWLWHAPPDDPQATWVDDEFQSINQVGPALWLLIGAAIVAVGAATFSRFAKRGQEEQRVPATPPPSSVTDEDVAITWLAPEPPR